MGTREDSFMLRRAPAAVSVPSVQNPNYSYQLR